MRDPQACFRPPTEEIPHLTGNRFERFNRQVAMSCTNDRIVRDQTIPSDLNEVRRLQAEIEVLLQVQQFAERDIFHIKLAVEEALVNAIKHGNQLDPDKPVVVRYEICSSHFEVMISDQGTGFQPEEVPDPTAPENLERPCGRGLFLIRRVMDVVSFSDEGKTIQMSKVRQAD